MYNGGLPNDNRKNKQVKALWTGSDSLYLITFPPSRKINYIYMLGLRIFARIIDLFVQEHYAVSEKVRQNLQNFGMRKPVVILIDPPKYVIRLKKKKHNGINGIYYYPVTNNDKFARWVYGIDIIDCLINKYQQINWIRIDGQKDMNEVYPIADFYIRPTRHDGHPRMIDECKIQDLPYYWSENGMPELKKIEAFIDKQISLR